MDKLTVAEHLLTPITGHTRATEIVGDLFEQSPSTVLFWFAIARVILAYSWRWLVGIPAAMFSVILIGIPYTRILEPQLPSIISTHNHNPTRYDAFQLSGFPLLAAIILASIALLALSRYGWRSCITRIAAVLSVTLSISAFALCVHYLRTGQGFIVLSVLLAAAFAIHDRRATATILTTAVGFVALFFAWSICLGLLLVGVTTGWHSRAAQLMPYIAFATWGALYVAEAVILSRTARWLRVVVNY